MNLNKRFNLEIWLCVVYLTCNLAMIIVYAHSGLVLQEVFRSPYDSSSIFFCYMLLFINILFFYLIYMFNRRGITPINYSSEGVLSIFIISLSLCYIVFLVYFNVNTHFSHGEKGSLPSIFSYPFILFNPNYLIPIYLLSCSKPRWLKTNCFLYLLMNALKGVMGAFFILVIICFLRSDVKCNRRAVSFTIIPVLALIVILLPLIIQLKWGLRSSDPDKLHLIFAAFNNAFLSGNYISQLSQGLLYVFQRLSFAGILNWIYVHSPQLSSDYARGAFKPFWATSFFGLAIYKIMGYSASLPDFSQYLVKINGGNWNTNTGLIGWLMILPFWSSIALVGINLAQLLIAYQFAIRVSGRLLVSFVFVMSILLIFHGWLIPFSLFTFNLFSFLMLRKLFQIKLVSKSMIRSSGRVHDYS